MDGVEDKVQPDLLGAPRELLVAGCNSVVVLV